MFLKWYTCKNCGAAVKKESTPNISGCPKSNFHKWFDLGKVGDNNFCCKKCGLIVGTENPPSTSGCTKSNFHEWYKL